MGPGLLEQLNQIDTAAILDKYVGDPINRLIEGIGNKLDDMSAAVREKCSSMAQTVKASVSSGLETTKNAVGLGPKDTAEKGGPGLALAQDISPSQSVGKTADGGLGTKGMDANIQQAVANCDWAKNCNMQDMSADLGQLPPPHTIAQVQTKEQGMAMA